MFISLFSFLLSVFVKRCYTILPFRNSLGAPKYFSPPGPFVGKSGPEFGESMLTYIA